MGRASLRVRPERGRRPGRRRAGRHRRGSQRRVPRPRSRPAGCGQQEHEREGVEAIHQPVGLGLRERDDEGDDADRGEDGLRRRDDGDRDGGGDSERGAERLAADAVAFAHDDVQDQDEHRLGNPVGLGPAQRHPDRRGGTENESEHARHPGGDSRGKVIAVHDPWSAEPVREDDAVERRDREDHAVDHGVGHRGDGRDERSGVGDHQQRGKPPEPDPGAGNDSRGGQ